MIRLWGQRLPKESVGKYLPYVFSDMRQVPFLPVCQGWTDRLAFQGFDVTAILPVSGASLFLSNDNEAALFKDGGGPGVIQIDGEQIRYASRSGRQLSNITRGVNGSTAAPHAPGAICYEVVNKITCVGPENPQVAWNDGSGSSAVRLYGLSAINTVYMGGAKKLSGDPPTHSVQATNSTFIPGTNVALIIFDMTTLVLDRGGTSSQTQTGVALPSPGGGIGISGGSDAPKTPEEWSRFAWNILRRTAWEEPPDLIWDASRRKRVWFISGGDYAPEDYNASSEENVVGGGGLLPPGDSPEGDLDLPSVLPPDYGLGGQSGGTLPGGSQGHTPDALPSPSYGGGASKVTEPIGGTPQPASSFGGFAPLSQVQPSVPSKTMPPPQQIQRLVALPPQMIGSITADVVGATDDDAGTITGTPGTILRYPAHIIKLIMAAGFGENVLARYADWSEAHARHVALDIQWNMLFEPVPFTQFQEQAGLASICDFYEDNIQWYLRFRQRRAPVITLDTTNVIGQPKFADPSMRELTTDLEVKFGLQPWTDGSFTLGDSPFLSRLGPLRARHLNLPWIATYDRAYKIARAWYPYWDGPRQTVTLSIPLIGLALQKTDTFLLNTPLMSTYGPEAVAFEIRVLRHRLNEGLIELVAVEGDNALTFIERLLLTETLKAGKGVPSIAEVQATAEAFAVSLIPGQEFEILTEVLGTASSPHIAETETLTEQLDIVGPGGSIGGGEEILTPFGGPVDG